MEDQERSSIEDSDVRKGPWTEEEDAILINYVSLHGEARWNNIARSSGLKRTGKSCRLRWLNYLRPDVRRGNITLQEQFLILKLHSQWGNRWSKIAQYLPGRTDNEIKNYWRTRVQKQAKQLKCDVNSKLFKDTMRNVWMPRLLERIQAQSSTSTCQPEETPNTNMGQPVGLNEPAGTYQFNPISNQYVVASELSSMASSNSPDTNGGSGLVDGSGMDLGKSGFEEFNDWGYGGDGMEKLWDEDYDHDSFWLLQNQFCDVTSYFYSF